MWNYESEFWVSTKSKFLFENNSDYTRAFEIDFEKYAKEDEVEIFVSIK